MIPNYEAIAINPLEVEGVNGILSSASAALSAALSARPAGCSLRLPLPLPYMMSVRKEGRRREPIHLGPPVEDSGLAAAAQTCHNQLQIAIYLYLITIMNQTIQHSNQGARGVVGWGGGPVSCRYVTACGGVLPLLLTCTTSVVKIIDNRSLRFRSLSVRGAAPHLECRGEEVLRGAPSGTELHLTPHALRRD